MTDQIGSGTAQGLIEYLDQLVVKGKATPGSIVPLKSTLKQVLSTIDGEEDWKKVNIRELDTTDYIERFKNKTIGKYAAPSYPVYLSRINKIKEWYIKFLLDPGWTPKTETNGKLQRLKIKQSTSAERSSISEKENTDASKVEKPVNNNVLNDLITYPFPLREGKIVYLSLPIDLTSVEAGRLSKFLDSVSVDKNTQ
jgi:hypothetical protein